MVDIICCTVEEERGRVGLEAFGTLDGLRMSHQILQDHFGFFAKVRCLLSTC